jgi:Phage tail tube protein
MGTFVNSGIGAQLVGQLETTYGVAPALTGANLMPLEFNTESLELKKTAVQGKGLHAGGLHNRAARRKVTNYECSGNIAMDLPTRYINQLLMLMFGSKSLTPATLTQIATSGVYSATHGPGTMLGSSATFQVGKPSVDGGAASPFTYVGCKVTDWEISVATGALAQLSLSITGRNELAGATNSDPLNASAPALATFTENANNDVFHFREATLLTGGTPTTTSGVTSITGATAAGNVKMASVKYAMKYDNARYFLGSAGFKAEPIENDFRDITGSIEVEFLNAETMYNAFAADTPTALQFVFTGPIIGTSGTNTQLLKLLIPVIYLEGESPKVGGPAVLTQKIPFTGLDDLVNNPLQATYQTVDTV